MDLQTRTKKARKVRYLILDVDGILTNGNIFYDEEGREIKAFSIYDGYGIRLLQNANIGVGVISGRASAVVSKRLKELHIEDLYQGAEDKGLAYDEICKRRQLTDDVTAFMGDDLIDLSVFRRVGLAISVPNAMDIVKAEAHWITKRRGGEGAVREVADFILKVQGNKTNIQ